MKKTAILTAIAVFVTLMAPISSFAMSTNDAVEQKEAILVNTEVVNIGGIPVRFDLYNDKGIMVETATPLSDTVASAFSSGQNPKFDINAIIAVADSRLPQASTVQPFALPSPYQFTASGVSEGHNQCFAGHWGDWSCFTMTPFWIASDSMYARGVWMGNGNPYGIQLTQSIKWSGLTISLSYPAGFSVQAGSDSATWSSNLYTGNFLATAYTGSTKAYSLFSTLFLSIDTRSDIYVNSYTSYAAFAKSSCSVYDWAF